MRWILDDGPLGSLADVASEERLVGYGPGKLWIAEQTQRDADQSPSRAELLTIEVPGGEKLIESFEIQLGTADPAERILMELHDEASSTVNLAEQQAIAWAQTHADDAVLVTADKRAAMIALAELGRSRVAHPFDLWIHLLEAEALALSEFRALCNRTRGKDQGLPRMPDRVTSLL